MVTWRKQGDRIGRVTGRAGRVLIYNEPIIDYIRGEWHDSMYYDGPW